MHLLLPDLGLFVWTLLAFAILFFLLRKFAWRPLLNMLGERERGIAESIAAADRVKKEMAQMQSDNERLLQQAREERAALLREAKEQSDAIIAKAKNDTKAITDKMIADAGQQIQQQKMAAMTEVKNQIGMLSVAVAEKILRKQLSSEDAQSEYAAALANDVTLN